MKLNLKIWWVKLLFHIFLITIATLLMILLISFYLKIKTHHNQSYFAPNFKGLTLKEAIEKAKKEGYNLKVRDSVYNAPYKPGTIIDQNPPYNFKVKKGRTFYVTIKAFTTPMTTLPNIKSENIVTAASLLQNAGLNVGKITYRPATANQYNTVLEVLYKGKIIREGYKLPLGSKVDLIVSKKISKDDEKLKTKVPDFTGLTLWKAKYTALEKSLIIDPVHFDDNVITTSDTMLATVYKQIPKPGEVVKYGTKVEIWLKK